jgi:hypothetical protein
MEVFGAEMTSLQSSKPPSSISILEPAASRVSVMFDRICILQTQLLRNFGNSRILPQQNLHERRT